MSAAVLPNHHWSGRRWLGTVLLIFAVQLGLIFWLSDRSPATLKRHRPAPGFRPAPAAEAEFIAMQNPTLFALPHPESFSGLAWLKRPATPGRFFEWAAEPALLPLNASSLEFSFASLLNQHQPLFPQTVSRISPSVTSPTADPLPGGPAASQFRLTEGLAGRTLLNQLALPAFAHTDLLSNTIVRVALGVDGVPVSLALVATSGSTDVDRFALEQSRKLRFAGRPAQTQTPDSLASLVWGNVVFEWATLALPATNNSGAAAVP